MAPGFEEARSFLSTTLRPGDLCLTMGAGNVDALGRSLVAEREPVGWRREP